jgi:hypothetical protein
MHRFRQIVYMLDPLLPLFGTGCVYTNSKSVSKPVDSGVLVFILTVNVLAHLLLLLMFIMTVCEIAHLVTLTGTGCVYKNSTSVSSPANTHYLLCLY